MDQKTPQDLLNERKRFYILNFYKTIHAKDLYNFKSSEKKSLDKLEDLETEDFKRSSKDLMLGLLMSDYRNVKYSYYKLLGFVEQQMHKEDHLLEMVDFGMLDLDEENIDKKVNSYDFY